MKKLLSILFLVISCFSFGQLTQNFESGTFPPTGWTSFDNGVGTASWGTTTSAALTYGATGTSAFLNKVTGTSATTAEEYLVTSQVTVPANGQLRFYTRTGLAGNDGSTFSVRVSTTTQTGTTAFTTIPTATWDENTLNAVYNVYEEKVISLTAFAGQSIYIAFVRTNENGDRWLIDNVNVVQSCNAPTAPTAPIATVGTTFASLGWTGPAGATQWQIEVVPLASNFTGVPNYTANSNPFVVTGLTQGTAYKFQVRAICPSGFPSDWSATSTNFTTTIPGQACAAPIVVGTLPYSTTSNTSNFGDTNDIAQPLACSGSATNYMAGNDVFYTYTPTVSGNISVSLTPTGTNSSLHIYNACPGTAGATCLTGIANATTNVRVINPFPVTAGTTYYIIISSTAATQTFGYTLDIQQVFCTQPSALTATAITSTSATLSWGNPSGATSWEVSVAPAPYGLPTGAGTTVNTNTGYVYNGVSGVVYQYYVRANCNDGNFSIWSGPFTFTLPQVAVSLPFTDGFETITGWTLSNGSGTGNQVNKWAIGTAVNNGGTHAMYITNDNGVNNAYALTNTSIVHAYKDFVIPAGATQAELKFDWRAFGEAANDLIRVWAIPGTTTPTAGTGLAASASNIKAGNDLLSFSTWNTVLINDLNVIPFAGNTMRLVFEWRNNATLGTQPPGAIDNIELKIVTCPKPKNLASANVSYNQAQVSWVNGGTETQWEVLVLPQGSATPTATATGTVVNSPSPYLITGLNSVTCYDVYVRAICSTTDKSYWSLPLTICTTPNFCSGDHFTDTGGTTGGYQNSENYFVTACPGNIGDVVTVVFNSFNVAAGDNLIIRNGDLPTSPIVGTYTGANLPPSFTSTSPSGCLTFSFTSNTTGTSTGWDATIYCTPPITCFKPTAVTVSNITATTASVSWTESGSATQWQILVFPVGSNVPSFNFTGISATSPFLVTGLNPSSTYTFYVRSLCSSTDKSFWTDGVNFTTTPLNDLCTNATVAILNDDLNCTLLNNGVLTGATPTATPTLTCSATANDVWYSFVATKPTHTFSLSNILPASTTVNFALYSGTCNSLTQIQCGSTSYVANSLVIGQTYYVRVYTTASTNTAISFKLCIGAVPCPEAVSLCNQPRTYPNATGVINLGPYGCLGSSPNASFFFLEAAQSGSLSYTINQVTTGGTPIDVDYALWGPFPSRDAGCVLIPNGSPLSCSYSAAATENFTITVTQGQVYILMVTNFANQAGSVTITPNANNTAQSFCYPYNTFNYSAVTYCSNSVNQTPVLVAGATAGTYSASPAGLSINSVTGEINFATSTPGTYTVTSTLIPTLLPPATNNPIICTRTVIVTPNPNASIAYSSASYCNSDSVAYPVVITGTAGPNTTYSSTPLGLQYALDPISGAITPSLATPGTYTITMSVPAQGGCAAYTTNTSVEIKTAPQLPIKVDVNGCNSYTLPALTTGVYYTGSNATGTQLNAGDVITTTQVVYVYATNGDCSNQVSFKVNIISIPTPTASVTAQPTCSTQTGNMQVTSPITQSAVTPSDLFISEVTDANTGALSYVELYNGTGSAKNLANYKLKMYNNGNATATWQQTLSGTIANNSTFVIKISNDPSIPGVSHNLLIPNSGVDTNDNIRLTTVTDVEVDMWGPTNGTVFTPNNQPGYTYRRLASSTPLPTTTWTPAQWSTLDPENYSNIGQYSLYVSNYQYAVDSGTFQSGTTFSGLTPGSHTLIVHDLINDCYSSPSNFTIDAVPYTNPVTSFTYTTPVCNSNTTNPSPALATGFTSGGTFSATPTGLDINSTTGVINLVNSTVGSYTVTYNYPGDLTNCINSGSSTAPIVISSIITPTFNQVAAICSGATLTALPTTSTNNIVGSWSPALNNTATTTYTFTPNTGQCAITTTMTITVNPNITPTFTPVSAICSGDVLSALPTTSTNSITGTWSPAPNNTATTTYTFTPTAGQCATSTTMTITVNPFVQPVFTPIADLCVGAVPIVLSSTSTNGVTGVWSPSTVDTASAGTTVYNFTPNGTGCYLPTSLTVSVHQCQIQRGISPNGDGLNDYLELTAEKVEIFNRYGGKVYSKVNYHNDWFGQSDSGSVLPDGTYYYAIKLLGGELKTGWIYINKEN
ncbi:gliding motility-associated C-terminal domain-containing protein [Flavobacterium sp. 20NA77.7]|uniref:Gliding motility-associated C-terminal domain-containing protein n=1 Tax=Flavobacterium nakdongensis TaxID=3073563 RepID=A0ABY9RCC6_9FLAO|nr:gliding motility-associated C-terminal domain-containing protein [Flavobacterium sp. 20NA77.7]WMW77816.1 gliding motility-associated C-terminal domain-containing protein [Flavobacterium sp. 20NA77.7]